MTKKLLIFIFLVGVPFLAQATDVQKPKNIVLSYGDWYLTCMKGFKPEKFSACQLQKTYFRQGDYEHSFILKVRVFAVLDQRLIEIELPLGVDLNYGVHVGLGETEGKQIRLPYSYCLPYGCIAAINAGSDLFKILLKKKNLVLGFMFADQEASLECIISMYGFKEGNAKLDELIKYSLK